MCHAAFVYYVVSPPRMKKVVPVVPGTENHKYASTSVILNHYKRIPAIKNIHFRNLFQPRAKLFHHNLIKELC
jgi:hypothetical protein